MSKKTHYEEHLENVAKARRDGSLVRAQSKRLVYDAAEAVLLALRGVLGPGGYLRGLPNLAPAGGRERGHGFYGARIAGIHDRPVDGSPALVLTSEVRVVRAWASEREVHAEQAILFDWRVEHLDAFLSLLDLVLPLHCAAAYVTSSRYEGVAKLAARVKAAAESTEASNELSPIPTKEGST